MVQRILLQGVLLVMLTGSLWWFLRPGEAPPPPAATTPELPARFLEHLRMQHMDEHGRVQFELASRSMEHFTSDGRAVFDHVDLVYHVPEHPPWHLDARRAEIPGDRQSVWLEGDVILRVRRSGDPPETVLRTPAMRVYLSREEAVSDAGVVMTHGNSRAEAQHMMADLATGHVWLEHNVRSIHEPDAQQ